MQQASELEQQVSEVRHQLQEERHKCRLLMDYPFVKQTTGSVPLQKQISANTVRILLLEEQNADLRDKIVQAAQAQGLEKKDMFQVGKYGAHHVYMYTFMQLWFVSGTHRFHGTNEHQT